MADKKCKYCSMMMILILNLCFFILSGCAPLVLDIKQPSDFKVTKINVQKVEIINKAEIEPQRVDPYSSQPNPLKRNIQEQFHESIMQVFKSHIIPSENGYNKAVVILEKAVVSITAFGGKSIPLLGILFLGKKEDCIAIIEAAIEIEDDQKHVIDRAAIHVKAISQGAYLTEEDIKKLASETVNKSLKLLQEDITEKTGRYLYKYLF
jgi:hypothetical protein